MTRLRASLALVGGLMLASGGGGLGIPHLAKVGWSITTAVGLLAFILGLGLVGLGAVVLVRSFHGLARAGVLLAIVALAYVVVPTIGLAVAATHVPPTEVGSTTPADLGLEYRDVRFRAADGVALSGWYVPSRNRDAVVLLHGAGSTRSAVLEHARILADLGYGVLLYDARGHGRSDGRAMDFGWYGDEDVAGAVAFVRRQPDAAGRVSAVGLSMGGEQAVGALPVVPELCAVVAEGATARAAADKAWLSDAYGLRGLLQEGLDRLKFGVTDVLTPASPPRSLRSSVRAAAPRRVLLIAAGREADESKAADHIEKGAPGSVAVWVAPGTGHTGALEARRSEWIQRVGEFLAAAEC